MCQPPCGYKEHTTLKSTFSLVLIHLSFTDAIKIFSGGGFKISTRYFEISGNNSDLFSLQERNSLQLPGILTPIASYCSSYILTLNIITKYTSILSCINRVATSPGKSWKVLELVLVLEKRPGKLRNLTKVLEKSWNFFCKSPVIYFGKVLEFRTTSPFTISCFGHFSLFFFSIPK